MPTFAAIDIGSNSCRLKIAKVVAHQLRTLHEDREVTRLGASVFASGLVSPEAMAATPPLPTIVPLAVAVSMKEFLAQFGEGDSVKMQAGIWIVSTTPA